MKLLDDAGRAIGCRVRGADAIGAVTPERLRILRTVSSEPKYPAEIARELGMPAQVLYYHVRRLEKAGLLEFVEYEERNGGVAKKYRCASDSFAVVVSENWAGYAGTRERPPSFIAPFVKNDFFSGKIVVGSPEPHGKYRARASELGVLELAMLLGRYAHFSFPAYMLDTQLAEKDRKKNLILAGGPKVNTVIADVNETLPVRFSKNNSEIFSSLSKKSYSGNIGIVELAANPFSPNAKMLVVGGLNYYGTRAAVLALVGKMKELEKGNRARPKVPASVMEGFDEDGDGMVDAVEILE